MPSEFLESCDITASDLPSEQMQLIADRCGISDALSLMDQLPGLEIYVPAAGKKALDLQYIKDHHTGYNSASIAIHLGIDRRKVEKLSRQATSARCFLTNDHMRLVSELCGPEVASRLVQHFPRYRFYIPTDGFSIVRRRYIERTFNGRNVQDLALKCQVTERYVRNVISDMYTSRSQCTFLEQLGS